MRAWGRGVAGGQEAEICAEAEECSKFSRPSDVAVDGQGRAFTSEFDANRIQLFRPVPVTSILSGPDGRTADSTPTFTLGSDEAGSTFECRIPPAAFAPCSGPGNQHTTESLADGPHTLEVRATFQGATDPTPATRTFTVDTTAPQLGLDEPQPGSCCSQPPRSRASAAWIRAMRTT